MKNLKEFIKQYSLFIDETYNGDTWANPETVNLKSWFSNWADAHKSFIDKLGGDTCQDYNLTVENDLSFDMSEEDISEIKEYKETIKEIIPDYLKTYNLTEDDLLGKYIGKVKIQKHISQYIDRNKNCLDRYHTDWGLSFPEKKRLAVDNITYSLAEISKIVSENSIKKGHYVIRFTFDPLAFLMLGHYGECDPDSCFANGGGHERDKYVLGNIIDSFVVLLYETKSNFSIGDNQDPISRGWGFRFKKGEICFNNIYSYTVSNIAIQHLFKTYVLKDIFGDKKYSSEPNKMRGGNFVYVNAEFGSVYYPEGVKKSEIYINEDQIVGKFEEDLVLDDN
jgi:hypothetical protein